MNPKEHGTYLPVLFVVSGQTSIKFPIAFSRVDLRGIRCKIRQPFLSAPPVRIDILCRSSEVMGVQEANYPQKGDKTESGVVLSLHYIASEIVVWRVKG